MTKEENKKALRAAALAGDKLLFNFQRQAIAFMEYYNSLAGDKHKIRSPHKALSLIMAFSAVREANAQKKPLVFSWLAKESVFLRADSMRVLLKEMVEAGFLQATDERATDTRITIYKPTQNYWKLLVVIGANEQRISKK